jgi:hypothetical protein
MTLCVLTQSTTTTTTLSSSSSSTPNQLPRGASYFISAAVVSFGKSYRRDDQQRHQYSTSR